MISRTDLIWKDGDPFWGLPRRPISPILEGFWRQFLNQLLEQREPGLRRKLLKLGSPPKAHSYLPIEVEIIINALGEPYGKTYWIKVLVIPRMARDRLICHSAIFWLSYLCNVKSRPIYGHVWQQFFPRALRKPPTCSSKNASSTPS